MPPRKRKANPRKPKHEVETTELKSEAVAVEDAAGDSSLAETVTAPAATAETLPPEPAPPLKVLPSLKPLAVKVELKVEPAKPKKLYWYGLMPNAPLQYVTLGGICFQNETEMVRHNRKSGVTNRIPRRGQMTELEDDVINLVRERIGDIVVRKVASRYEQWSRSKLGFKYNPVIDTPLAQYLFLMEVPPELGEGARGMEPEAILSLVDA